MEQYNQMIMVKWKVDYCFNDDTGKFIIVSAQNIRKAMTIAEDILSGMSEANGWSRWMIWDIGIMVEECFN